MLTMQQTNPQQQSNQLKRFLVVDVVAVVDVVDVDADGREQQEQWGNKKNLRRRRRRFEFGGRWRRLCDDRQQQTN